MEVSRGALGMGPPYMRPAHSGIPPAHNEGNTAKLPSLLRPGKVNPESNPIRICFLGLIGRGIKGDMI